MNTHELYTKRCLQEKILKTLRTAAYLHPEATELDSVIKEDGFEWGTIEVEEFLESLKKFGNVWCDPDKGEECPLFKLNEYGFHVANEYNSLLSSISQAYFIGLNEDNVYEYMLDDLEGSAHYQDGYDDGFSEGYDKGYEDGRME